VTDVSIPRSPEDGRPRGFAFVEMASEAEAKAAIETLNGQELGGRALRIDEAGRPSPRPGGFARGPNDRPAFRPKPKGSRRNLRAKKRGF
jgi:cold-inducible RNA-binding protein